jgi:hypothetical protein
VRWNRYLDAHTVVWVLDRGWIFMLCLHILSFSICIQKNEVEDMNLHPLVLCDDQKFYSLMLGLRVLKW